MLLLESAPEIVAGVAVEVLAFTVAAAVVFRALSGRFLVPKREIILPNQLGVIVQADSVVRVAQPGPCWIRPRQRIILVDARPKPLQMLGVDVLGSDSAVVRLSLSGEYRTVDAATYYANSANAAEALYVRVRRAILSAARQQTGGSIVGSPEVFAARVRERVAPHAEQLGLAFLQLEVWEALPMGFLSPSTQPEMDEPSSGLVQ